MDRESERRTLLAMVNYEIEMVNDVNNGREIFGLE